MSQCYNYSFKKKAADTIIWFYLSFSDYIVLYSVSNLSNFKGPTFKMSQQ